MKCDFRKILFIIIKTFFSYKKLIKFFKIKANEKKIESLFIETKID